MHQVARHLFTDEDMKSICMAAVLTVQIAGTTSAETIGVSMQSFDNNFQTLLREGLSVRASVPFELVTPKNMDEYGKRN